MRPWMLRSSLCLAPLLLAGCSDSYEPPRLTEKQTSELERALAGKVPGERTSCVNRESQSNLTAISNSVLLYRVSRRLVYRNDLIGSCSGLSRGDTLIIRTWGSQYCRGDQLTSADLMTGMVTGNCALGDFIPYRAPSK
ncbi:MULTISPECIES: hypothetical protein [unclassified Sphingobium]|uniref:hypothetical protein n=1 Tax=unclassified Sphingobium TaxID=2611147 RepID=UPI00065C7D3C|nr:MULTISPECIES: hypothetical protein [unclassified Sphingobium]OAP32208.1 hypothetical protein A8O16_10060 [Sphingobium sp. 20006FA]KXU32850.1 hypothetical protein AXW74_06025 [Sphingobium sp. AM]KYC32931.1 hypothetical protein A0J57_07995 [Sphingobium sp. 22B]MCB4858472.1 hypothetical protein [Sphingobium sp. PNB]UXC90208.1 hypothetical protein EGM87_14285 [Sphingobium sp. RSMS]